MMKDNKLRKGSTPAPAVRQVRAVVVCRPPGAGTSRRLSAAAAAEGALSELDISDPVASGELAPDAPDADLCRDVAVGREAALRLPLYGHRGAAAEGLCQREVAPLLRALLAGESAAVIAYGQTGSGKSYTMGTEKYEEGQGPAPHSVSAFCAKGVFALAQQGGVRELEVSLAAIEIYREGKDRERLFDLQTLERKRIESFESQAAWRRAASAEDLQRKLLDAAFLRNTDRTDGNARSSRSHAIFVTQIQFKRRQEEDGSWQRIKSRLMLVDLAGSERAALAQAGSATQKQGSGINVGLLFLGMVMNELAERGETKNYSFSVLTKILKPALGGGANEVTSSCNTLILGCISPLALHTANTRATLEFLQSAGTVKNVVRPDVQMLQKHEALALAAEVEDLRRQVRGLRLQLSRQQPDGAEALGAAPDEDAAASSGAAEAAIPPPDLGSSSGDGAAAALPPRQQESVGGADGRVAALEAEVASLRKALVVERDRADAFEAVLRQQQASASAQQAQQGTASGGVAVGSPGGTPVADAVAAGTPGSVPGTVAVEPAPGSPSSPATVAAPTPLAASTHPAAAPGRPSAALLAASPLLAASREVAEWVADAAAAAAATPPGQLLPLLRLLPGAEEVCCERESHMGAAELAALKDKVARLLAGAKGADDRTQALAFAEACLYSLLSYNKCLGDALTRQEDALEDLQAAVQQHGHEFEQLYSEKVQYMRRTAAAEGGLSEYEAQVEDLSARLAAAQHALAEAQAAAAAGTPSRWVSIGRLITSLSPGAEGPSPSPGAGGGIASHQPQRSGGASPAGSPRGGGGAPLQQQLFGAPSPPQHGQPPAGAADARRATVACLQASPAQQERSVQAAVAASLAGKQRRAAEALLGQGPLIKAVGLRGAGPGLPAALCSEERPSKQAVQQEQQQPRCQAAGPKSGIEGEQPAAAGPASPSQEQQQQQGQAAAGPAHGGDREERQQGQQVQAAAGVLPGPCITVLVPAAQPTRPRGRTRGGGGRPACLNYEEFEFCPATNAFTLPGSGKDAERLGSLLKALPPEEPWQRRVLLKAPTSDGLSGVTLEGWLARRALQHGRCHFCCRAPPDPSLRHPEPSFSQLRLCGDCHAALEPGVWRCGPDWTSSDPSDPGLRYCCLCGAAGTGSTDQLVMCSSCELCGFCSGCLWRFSGDDLAAVLREDARFVCLLCRPEPRLQLRYADDEAAEQPALPRTASQQAAGRGRGDALPGGGASGSEPDADADIFVDLGSETSTGGSGSSSSSEEEYHAPPTRRPAPASGRLRQAAASAARPAALRQRASSHALRQRASSQPPGGRRKAGGSSGARPAAEAEAWAAARSSGAGAALAPRKRTRLLARGDVVDSPPLGGERPAVQRQRRQLQPQRRQGGSGGGQPSQPGTSLSSQLHDLLHL